MAIGAAGVLLMLGVGNIKEVNAEVCQFDCYDGLGYMTCPSTGDEHLPPACNCCFASAKGCVFHFKDGHTLAC